MEMKETRNQIVAFLDKRIHECQMLVVGDVMLDQYLYGDVVRISPEAPVPVTHIERKVSIPGGASNVACNLARLGCQTYLAGIVGKDFRCGILEDLLHRGGVGTDGLMREREDTIAKIRIIGGHQQMIRLDFEETSPIEKNVEDEILGFIQQRLSDGLDGIVVSDYKKGVCTKRLCQTVISYAHCADIPVFVDPKQRDWQSYAGADYITPNLKELGEAAGRGIRNMDEAVAHAAQHLAGTYDIRYVIVTRSEKGLSIVGQKEMYHLPATSMDVFDVSGAGDTVIAVLSAAIAGGLPVEIAAYLANIAAGISIGKVGTYAVSAEEILHVLRDN